MPARNHTAPAPAIKVNTQNPATWLKPDEPLIGADGRDWSWCYVWHKDIGGFPGYKVGTDGSIWSKWRKGRRGFLASEWARLSLSTRKGYLVVSLTGPTGKIHTPFVHRMVLEAFVGRRPHGMQCRHLNGDRSDASLFNICWGTPKANGEDRVRHGNQIRGARQHLSKLDDHKVREIRKLRRSGMAIASIGKMFGVSDVNVSYICLKKTWTHVPD